MSGVKLEVVWSPNQDDVFITWGTDINLYKVKPVENEERQTGLTLNSGSVAILQCKYTDLKYLKCLAWNPDKNEELLFALGLASGQVILSNLGAPAVILEENAEIELNSKHLRQCNSLKWSYLEPNLLAAGFERSKTEYAINIWDIKSSKVSELQTIYEKGKAETANSLAWLHHQEKTIIAGMNNKNLKLFDLRESTISSSTTLSKAVYDVTPDPHNYYRVASYVENQVHLWDLRYFEKPLSILNDQKPVSKLYWSPTRHNMLAALHKDSSSIKLYDIRLNSSSEETEPSVIERHVSPCGDQMISSFSWHHSCQNRMVISTTNCSLMDLVIPERLSLSWHASCNLVWSEGKNYYCDSNMNPNSMMIDVDVSDLMKRRSSSCYKLKSDSPNMVFDLTFEGPLRNLCHWMETSRLMNSTVEDKSNNPDRHIGVRSRHRFQVLPCANSLSFCGVRSLLYGSNLDHHSPCLVKNSIDVSVPWNGLIGGRMVTVRIYRSEERDKVLKLCGWGLDKPTEASPVFERPEKNKDYCRLAALSIFRLQLKDAITYLEKGAESGDCFLMTVAMAISGFTDEPSTLWKETCTKMRSQLSQPYLNAVFAFLTEEEPYEGVLGEPGISIQDKIAFCATFLNDTNLVEVVESLTIEMKEEGNLDGMLLTGLTPDGLDLLQEYVDVSGDVQIPSLLVVSGLRDDPTAKNDERVKAWIESYRQLLDCWELWYERSLFDIQLHKFDPSSTPSPQVFASCNFCSKSISPFVTPNTKNNRNMYVARMTGASANKPKLSSCPSCRKPLPRCSLCLKYMGTESATHPPGVSLGKTDNSSAKLSPLSHWFTWCQSCRHGGHANHITQWFREHTMCPVTGCSCRCMSVDCI